MATGKNTLQRSSLIRQIGRVSVLLLLAVSAANADALPRKGAKYAWIKWIDEKIDALVHEAQQDHNKQQDNTSGLALKIQEVIDAKDLKENPHLTKYKNFFDFVDASRLRVLPDHQFGYAIDDDDYLAETTKFTDIPEILNRRSF
jgi:hypothetical protein